MKNDTQPAAAETVTPAASRSVAPPAFCPRRRCRRWWPIRAAFVPAALPARPEPNPPCRPAIWRGGCPRAGIRTGE